MIRDPGTVDSENSLQLYTTGGNPTRLANLVPLQVIVIHTPVAAQSSPLEAQMQRLKIAHISMHFF